MTVNFFVTALATEFWMLLAVRVMGGAVCANIAVANAYVADISEPQDRAKNFGLLGAMFGVGFFLGPVMGGLLGDINVHWPFFLAGTLTLLNCVYGYFVLPESLPAERRREFTLARANPFTALANLRQLKGGEMLLWVMGLSILAQFCLHTSWFLYTEFKFGWTPKDNGLSLFAMGMMALLVQGGLLRQFQRFLSTDRLVRIGLVSSTVAFAAWGLVPEGWMMYVANVFGYMVQPGLQSMVANAVDPTRQGEGMGAVSSINSVASVLGPLMGSTLLATVSHFPQGDWRIGAPFYLCAAIQAVAAWLGFRDLSRAGNLRASARVA
jgi:DHA1 family tetracycline resistance protein-like MFS transporter